MTKYLLLAAVTVLLSKTAVAADPVLIPNMTPAYVDIRGPECDASNDSIGMITDSTPSYTLIYDHVRRGSPLSPAPCNPVIAPDGHQLTLAEVKAIQGTALVTCVAGGTQTVLRFSGLRPRGVYSLWLVGIDPQGGDGLPGLLNFAAVGTLGKTDPSENFFKANSSGEGVLTRITPDQDLSVGGHVGSCLLDSPTEIHLVLHSDQATHGKVPGPPNTWVVLARFRIP